MPLFSIIIPAYNAEKHIRFCIESVLKQDFVSDQYEIIVIDDCSPDNQVQILKEYEKIYKNIIFLQHKNNLRQGGGRNSGLEIARGKWIFFLDSDDYWLRKDVLKIFYHIIEKYPNVDIIESSQFITTDKKNINIESETFDIQPKIVAPQEYYNLNPHPCIWASVYKKDYITKFRFREKVFFEDADWKIKVYTNTTKILLIDFPFYAYYNDQNSTTRGNNPQAYFDQIIANDSCHKEWLNSGLSSDFKENVLKSFHIIYVNMIKKINNYPFNSRIDLLRKLHSSESFNHSKKYFNKKENLLVYGFNKFPLMMIYSLRMVQYAKKFLLDIFKKFNY